MMGKRRYRGQATVRSAMATSARTVCQGSAHSAEAESAQVGQYNVRVLRNAGMVRILQRVTKEQKSRNFSRKIWSCESHRHSSPRRRMIKGSCTAARSAASAKFCRRWWRPHEHSGRGLKLRLHSLRLPSQVDHPRSIRRVVLRRKKEGFRENLMTCVMERVIRKLLILRTKLITTNKAHSRPHTLFGFASLQGLLEKG